MDDNEIMVSREPIHPGEFLREDYMPSLALPWQVWRSALEFRGRR